MKRSYSGALCGECSEWVREVVLCERRRFYVCLECNVDDIRVVIESVIATLPGKAEVP